MIVLSVETGSEKDSAAGDPGLRQLEILGMKRRIAVGWPNLNHHGVWKFRSHFLVCLL
jgi:hypothetical protein